MPLLACHKDENINHWKSPATAWSSFRLRAPCIPLNCNFKFVLFNKTHNSAFIPGSIEKPNYYATLAKFGHIYKHWAGGGTPCPGVFDKQFVSHISLIMFTKDLNFKEKFKFYLVQGLLLMLIIIALVLLAKRKMYVNFNVEYGINLR